MTMPRRTNSVLRASSLILAVAAFAASGVAARADQIVYFTNGKAITVKKVEKGDRLTILEIEGGGRIGIPTVQIDRIEEHVLSAAAPAVTIPAILPAPQPAPTTNTPPPAPAAPSAAMPAGPGTGGHVAPNTPANGAQPLALGTDSPEETVKPQAAARPAGQAPTGAPAGAAMQQAPQRQRNMSMMGNGPGGFQRNGGRGARNDYARGRLPAGAYLPPKNDPNAAAPAGQPGAAAQQPPAATGQAAQQPPAGTGQAAPPPAATPPPPPPPDPAETNAGSSDGSAEEAAPETGADTPADDDSDPGQR